MTGTRQLILDYLNSKQTGTAPEIARAIKMTAANARHHLSVLLKEGVVVVVGEHHTRDRGRPSLLYALSAHTRQHNLDRLSTALLEDVLSNGSSQATTSALKRIAGRLLREEHEIPASLSKKLFHAVRVLNEMHYDAHWEAHAEAPTIIFSFCPYAGILAERPELCEMDAHLIEALLARPATQIDKLVKDERGIEYCRFLIREG